MLRVLKKVFPRPVKEAVKRAARRVTMSAAVRDLRALPEGVAPSPGLLDRLGAGWGDDGFRAVGGYLEEVTKRAVETRGPVLEIGSGLTTVVVGVLAEKRGVEVWTLEHSPAFHEVTRREMARLRINTARLMLAPL